MIRTSLFSLALFALAAAPATQRDQAKPKRPDAEEVKEGFRVYTISPRCQARQLHGVYSSEREAFQVADDLRAPCKKAPRQVEVTTGSEGKKLPTGKPELYLVYTGGCKGGWVRREVACDAKKAEQVARRCREQGDRVEVVHDYKPKEVFHVYGGGCRRSWRLLGSYTSAGEAFQAAASFRADKKFSCDVTTGTRGKGWVSGSPVQYVVYERRSREGAWKVAATTKDHKKALEASISGKCTERELVHSYAGQ